MYDTHLMATRARLNWAENILLSHKYARSKTQPAVVSCVEPSAYSTKEERLSTSLMRKLTFEELYIEVAQASSALKKLGVGPGDRVAALTPNNAEAIIMVLATSSIGGVWSSCPPEFGVRAILERFKQLKPKVLLSTDKYRVTGKDLPVYEKLDEVAQALRKGGLEDVIVVGQLRKDRRPAGTFPRCGGAKVLAYPDFLDRKATEVDFWRGPANAPLCE